MEYFEVKVQEIKQGVGVRMFSGVMRAGDLLELWDVERFVEDELIIRGYQRQEAEQRFNEIADYVLMDSPIMVFPASLVVSVRKGELVGVNGDRLLRISKGEKVWIADGQHRLGGFARIKAKGKGRLVSEVSGEQVAKALNMQLPITFLYLAEVEEERAVAIERVIFYVINKTQKPIRASLKDYLQWQIAEANLFRHPLLEREDLRIKAVPLALGLHQDADSPLKGKVNVGDIKGLGRFLSLSGLVTSMQRTGGLLRTEGFRELEKQMQLRFLKHFWKVIREMFPLAFEPATRRDYFIFRNLTVQALMRLASDVFEVCQEDKEKINEDDIALEKLRPLLAPLKSFNFKAKKEEKSPLLGLGGEKGVAVAYELFRELLENAGILKP